jgi:hypothetical protein
MNQVKEEYTKLKTAYDAQTTNLKKLEATHKECSREKE